MDKLVGFPALRKIQSALAGAWLPTTLFMSCHVSLCQDIVFSGTCHLYLECQAELVHVKFCSLKKKDNCVTCIALFLVLLIACSSLPFSRC